MKIKNRELKIPIILNLIFALLLLLDFFIPSNKVYFETLSSVYNTVTTYPSSRSTSGGKEIKNILYCESDNLYYLGNAPDQLYKIEKGEKISITKTFFFSKVKSLKSENHQKKIYVSFLSIKLVMILFSIATLITILNCFVTNTFLDILLAASSTFIYFLTAVYLFFY